METKQTTLYGKFVDEKSSKNNSSIKGLTIQLDAIDSETHDELMKRIYECEWDDILKRRVQHYGFRYDYTTKTLDEKNKPKELPEWAIKLCKILQEKNLIDDIPNQLIINEYKPGQGISKHTDSKVFGDTIFSISLGSSCQFIMRNGNEMKEIRIPPRAFIKMQGAARYKWTHEIPAVKGKRVSLTFRYVNGPLEI